jgi:hypothetical protein
MAFLLAREVLPESADGISNCDSKADNAANDIA